MRIVDRPPAAQPIAREMTRWELFWSRLSLWRIRLRRKLPYLVWYGDEVDVRVCFSESKLGQCSSSEEAMKQFYSPNALTDAQVALRNYGVSFDSGMGFEGRDWEWDWSLKGPISVSFRGLAQKPERRQARPRPKLVAAR